MAKKNIETDDELARRVGLSRPAVTQMIAGSKRQVSSRTISALARELSLDGGILLKLKESETSPKSGAKEISDIPHGDAMLPANEVALADVAVPRNQTVPRNVPVLGTGMGGEEGDFILNGEIVEYVRRPPGIMNAANVFAIWLTGDSMSPRFSPGDLLYIHPGRQPRIGDDVLIELRQTVDGSRPAFVKRLVKRTETEIVVEQFNPPSTFSLDPRAVQHIYRILTTAELMGV